MTQWNSKYFNPGEWLGSVDHVYSLTPPRYSEGKGIRDLLAGVIKSVNTRRPRKLFSAKHCNGWLALTNVADHADISLLEFDGPPLSR